MQKENKYLSQFELIIIFQCLKYGSSWIGSLNNHLNSELISNLRNIEEISKDNHLNITTIYLYDEDFELAKKIVIQKSRENPEHNDYNWTEYTTDNCVNQFIQDAKEIVDKISENYKNGFYFLNKIGADKYLFNYINSNLNLDFEIEKKKRDDLQKKLDDYITNYSLGKLEGFHVFNYQKHLDEILEYISSKEENYAINLVDFNPWHPNSPFRGINDEGYLESWTRYKLIEFLLLFERKGYLQIRDMDFVDIADYFNNSNNKKKPVFRPFKANLSFLKNSKEIKFIENIPWLSFFGLSTRTDTGHTYNGNIQKVYDINRSAYKLLLMLIKEPERKFTLEEIEAEVFADNNKSASFEQMKSRINDLVKGIRKDLCMTEPESKVNILGSQDKYFLTIIPHK